MKDPLLDHYHIKDADPKEMENLIQTLPKLQPAIKLKDQLRLQLWILSWHYLVMLIALSVVTGIQCASYLHEQIPNMDGIIRMMSVYVLCICGCSFPELLRSRYHQMEEMEQSCRMTFGQLMLGRLWLLYGTGLLLLIMFSIWISFEAEIVLIKLVCILMIPIMLSLSLTLFLAKLFHLVQGSSLLILFAIVGLCVEMMVIPLILTYSLFLLVLLCGVLLGSLIKIGTWYWKELIQNETYASSSM